MTPQAKASQNSFKRPLKTSKLNPYAMRQTGYDETRISPKIAALKGQFGKTGSGYGQGGMSLPEIAEAKANYIPRSAGKAGTRGAAAEMLKGFRKTKLLSRADAQALVEFARGDQAIAHAAKKGWLSPAPDFHNESAGTMARGAEDSVFRASEIARLARDRGARANPKLGWTRRELAQSIVRDRSPGMKIARSGK